MPSKRRHSAQKSPSRRTRERPNPEPGTRNPEPGTVAILAFTLLAYAALAVGYATLTPIWQNPDEPPHYNYVAFVARTGGLPELKPGDWDSALLERLKNGRLQPSDSVESIRYEAWQPPLFYLSAAPVFLLGPTSDPTDTVMRLRLFNAVLGALTLAVAYLVAREVLPQPQAAAVPAVMVGVPMFTSVSAAISADPLANLISAAILLLLVRRVRPRPEPTTTQSFVTTPWPVQAGVLIGLGLLTKLALAIFLPLALTVVLVSSRRRKQDSLILLATPAVVTTPWLVHQATTYGWLDPLATGRHAAVVVGQPRFEGLSAEYVGRFLTTTFHSFWAQFGWMGIVAPDRLYWVYAGLVIAALAGLVIGARQLQTPNWATVSATVGMAFLAYIAYNLAFEQFQGRYLFTALVPIAMLLVAGWAALLSWERAKLWVVLLASVLLVGLNVFALTRVLVPGFAPAG